MMTSAETKISNTYHTGYFETWMDIARIKVSGFILNFFVALTSFCTVLISNVWDFFFFWCLIRRKASTIRERKRNCHPLHDWTQVSLRH